MMKMLSKAYKILIITLVIWGIAFIGQSFGYNLLTSAFDTIEQNPMYVPKYGNYQIYCGQYGNYIDFNMFSRTQEITWDRIKELRANPKRTSVMEVRKYTHGPYDELRPELGKTSWPHYDPIGGGSLTPAMAYIVSDEPIGGWSEQKQIAIWNLKGAVDKNGNSLDGGILDGGVNSAYGSSIYDKEAIDYADYDAKIKKNNGMNLKDQTNTDDVNVEINQTSKEYKVGPFKLDYINGTYGNITFAGISNMNVTGYNANDVKVKSNIQLDKFVLANGKTITPDYFTPSNDLKVDETSQGYPKPGESFYIVFKDPNVGVSSANARVCKISIEVQFKYMTAQGQYMQFKGAYATVEKEHSSRYSENNWHHTDDCTEIWEEDGEEYEEHYSWRDKHYCQWQTKVVIPQELQRCFSADADRTIHEQKVNLVNKFDITMDLGGHVWEDTVATKESKADGVSNTSGGKDIPLPNIKVVLYESNGKVADVAYTSNTLRTDKNGNYMFKGLDAMKKYYVKFEYNGQIYMPTEYLNTANGQYNSVSAMVSAGQYNTNNWRITSKGTELPSERDAFDKKFQEIGSYPNNYRSGNSYNSTYSLRELMGYTLGEDGKYRKTGPQLIDGYEYDENGQITTKYTLASGNVGNDAETRRKLQFIQDCQIAAYSGSPFKNGALDQYPVYDKFVIDTTGNNPIYTGQFYVNLGLWRRQEFDASLRKDVYRAIMKINNKTIMYKYDKRQDDDKYWDINVRMSDYNSYYGTGYTREIYRTDYEYNAKELKHPGEDLEIYVTYKITIRNQSQSIMGQIREVVDYYDKEYTYRDDLSWVTYVGDNKKNTVTDNEYYDAMVAEDISKIGNARQTKAATTSRYGSTTHSDVTKTYNAVYVKGLEDKKLATGESAYIYLTFQVNKQNGKVVLDNDSSPKMNYAEINGYVTYYRNNTVLPNKITKNSNNIAGLLDIDSNPGNLVQSDINNKEKYEKNFEDDTDRAKGLRILIDEKAIRKANGTVWEDERTVKSGDSVIGDGIRQNNEVKVQGVRVQLVEKTIDGREYIWQETTTDANGYYLLENYIPGDYIIRFYYGNEVATTKIKGNNNYTAGGQNDTSYNGQDFKSTTYQKGITQNNYTDEAKRYTGYKNVTTQNETGTYGYDIYAADSYQNNVSDAKDLWSVSNKIDITYRPNATISEKKAIKGRQSVINYSNQNMTNHKAEILASPYETPTYNGTKYTKSEMDALINELIANTYMTAETGVITAEFEYDRKQTDGLKTTENNSNNSSKNYVSKDNRYNGNYTLNNIDLGLTERPKAQLEIDKSITNLKVTLANGSVLFDVNKAGDNVIWKDHAEYDLASKKDSKGKYNEYYGKNGKNRYSYRDEIKNNVMKKADKGLIQLTIDEELMHGAAIEINYKVKVTNVGEVDYEGQRYYYLGDSSGANKVTTVANQVVDYIANNLRFNPQNASNQKWTIINNTTLIPSRNVDNDINLVNRRLDGNLKQFNSIIQTDGLNKVLKPGDSTEKTLALTQLISTENKSDDLTYSNITEIVNTTNTAGRRMAYSVVGNQDPKAADATEIDASRAERVIILPPFGNTHILYILGAVVAIMLVGGIVLIIKKVLRK